MALDMHLSYVDHVDPRARLASPVMQSMQEVRRKPEKPAVGLLAQVVCVPVWVCLGAHLHLSSRVMHNQILIWPRSFLHLLQEA